MIKENIEKILKELPPGVELAAAVKGRIIAEVKEAAAAGVTILADNYLQEAAEKIEALGRVARWHFIGHLQKNKVQKAAALFDMLETIDSFELAQVLDKECGRLGKVMPVLLEVNSADEPQKAGLEPAEVESFVGRAGSLAHLKISGLMTMGPLVDNPEAIRPFFRKVKEIFDLIKSKAYDNLDWRYLSMGMSDTYKIAIEEGANIVRIGTAIFGIRR